VTEPALPELTDSRRLTGANLFWDRPAAIIDMACDGDPSAFIAAWQDAVTRLLEATGRGDEQLTHRTFDGGASLLVSAPIDALYTMCELNEVAFGAARAALGGKDAADFSAEAARLAGLFAGEANPALLALQAAAARHGVPFLWDDDAVSVGHGADAKTWPPDQLPSPEHVDWNQAGAIPVALVTGTNGKSTTVRMSAAILAAAGLRAGLTSTDWIRVGQAILDRGDYSGTGGARTLLRHADTEVAVLETARGGLLRRGLGVDRASAALVTNVAADHLGNYGINTVPELVEAKFIVRRALHGDAPLILNADDAGCVDFAAGLDQPLAWFSLDPGHPLLRAHREAGGRAAVLEDGWLVLAEGEAQRRIIAADEIPATLGGAARHNIQNALGAMLLCQALGVDDDAIRTGLAAFRGDAQDNPGRSNCFEARGVRILVDFAHNEHGMRALARMVAAMPAQRRVLLMSQAGDRADRDIRDMVNAALEMHPDHLVTCDLPGYERGRAPGAIPALIRGFAVAAGLAPGAIDIFTDPVSSVRAVLDDARPGDLLVLLALSQRDDVLRLIDNWRNAGAT